MATKEELPLILLQILAKYTDKDNLLGTADIINILHSEYDLVCEKRSVYFNMALLKRYGHNISTWQENGEGYFLVDNQLNSQEISTPVAVYDGENPLKKNHYKNSQLYEQGIYEPIFLWLETSQKEYESIKAKTIMGRNEEIQLEFTLDNAFYVSIEQFYVYVQETGAVYEGINTSAQFKEKTLHLWFSSLQEIQIDPDEFDRYDQVAISKHAYGTFTVFLDAEYFDNSRKHLVAEKPAVQEEIHLVLQMEMIDEDRMFRDTTPGRRMRLKIPSSDKYDLDLLRNIGTLFVRYSEEFYVCNIDNTVKEENGIYILEFRILSRRMVGGFEMMFSGRTSLARYPLTNGDKLIIMKWLNSFGLSFETH